MTSGSLLDGMSRHPRLMTLTLGSALLITVVWAWVRLSGAHDAMAQAQERYRTSAVDVHRVEDLRRRSVTVSDGTRSDTTLVSRIQRVLSSVGLSPNAFQSMQPRTDQPTASGGPTMQSVEVLLGGLTPGEFGSWLSAWRSPDQPWLVREILLNHQTTTNPAGQQTAGMDSNRYQISVLLSAPSVDVTP
jgi:hypothetical protein